MSREIGAQNSETTMNKPPSLIQKYKVRSYRYYCSPRSTSAFPDAQVSPSNQGSSRLKAKVVYPQHKFRSTTQNNRTLNGMFLPIPSSSASSSAKNGTPSSENDEIIEVDSGDELADLSSTSRTGATNLENSGVRQAAAPLKVVESECYLQSVLDLREEIKAMRRNGACWLRTPVQSHER